MAYFRVNRNCNGCLACVENCPATALAAEDIGGRRTLKHNLNRCARCGQCWRVCPQQAIEFEHLVRGGWDEVVALDLIACRVCGAPLYTPAYGEMAGGPLGGRPEPLCPQHRQRLAAAAVAGAALRGAKAGVP